MRLNKQGREELRKLVEKELKDKTVEGRIKLDKDILELLLFETISYKKDSPGVVKIPVWSGPFLQKIDLSEISYEDVSWTLMKEGSVVSKAFDKDSWNWFNKSYQSIFSTRIDYSNTNAKIDFNKSFEYKQIGEVMIMNCSFAGTDLHDVDTSHFTYVQGCNFSNTRLVISEQLKKVTFPVFHYTVLSGLELGDIVIRAIDIASNGGPLIGLGCNLSNTRIAIVSKSEDFTDDNHKKNFRTILASGDLNGCYINGKRVLSLEEKQANAASIMKQYEDYKSKMFSSISKSIQKQISK